MKHEPERWIYKISFAFPLQLSRKSQASRRSLSSWFGFSLPTQNLCKYQALRRNVVSCVVQERKIQHEFCMNIQQRANNVVWPITLEQNIFRKIFCSRANNPRWIQSFKQKTLLFDFIVFDHDYRAYPGIKLLNALLREAPFPSVS